MRRRMVSMWKCLGLAAASAALAVPVHAAGFAIFEQGAKATGMAGAFTAQADDPSALFFNAGGLAFVERRDIAVGVTYIRSTEAKFSGADPFPGAGTSGTEKPLSVFPPHAYYVQPINSTWKLGLGIETPFGLTTEWKNPNSFPGRFLSTKAALQAFDINPTLAWQITPTLGIGVGGIARLSNIELDKVVGATDPFTLRSANIASVKLKGDVSDGYGFDIGILNRYNNSFSWGLSYRSRISIDYSGHAVLTQQLTGDPEFDAAVAAQTPFGSKLPVKTNLKYPDMASLGLAFALSPHVLLETDVDRAGWSNFRQVEIDFTNNDLPNSVITERWKNVWSYRAGLRWDVNPLWQWRFGYVYDQTPQPEQSVNPLLPDNNRNGFTLGFGHKGVVSSDFYLMYLDLGSRTRSKTFADDSQGDFFGTYKTRAILVGATFTF